MFKTKWSESKCDESRESPCTLPKTKTVRLAAQDKDNEPQDQDSIGHLELRWVSKWVRKNNMLRAVWYMFEKTSIISH